MKKLIKRFVSFGTKCSKKNRPQWVKYILTYVLLILAFILTLTLAALMPSKNVKRNVALSLEDIVSNPEIGKVKHISLDKFTAAIMLNCAYSIDSTKLLESIMINNIGYNPDESNGVANANPFVDLSVNIMDRNVHYYEYARYWHGYLIYLRPLLVFLDYQAIGILFTIILCALAVYLAYLLWKKVDKIIGIILLVLLFAFSYHYLGLSLTYVPVWAISMVASTIIVKKEKLNCLSFFIIGALTSFFDLLTTPILTLGIPLLVQLIVSKDKMSFKKMLLICINWIAGYGLLWLSKWVISDLLYGNNIIMDAIKTIGERTGDSWNDEKIVYYKVLTNNIGKIKFETLFIFFMTIVSLIIKIKDKDKVSISKSEILKYLFIAVIPLLWYFVTQNHSYIHARYTYRNMFITLFSLAVLDYKILKSSLQIKNKVKIEKGSNKE